MPLLSIVIANYNYGRYLEAAIRSVLSQATPEVELIVIDGGSTDESVEVIKRYAEKRGGGDRRRVDDTTLSYWVSEPDHGQSDAFNKGFARARGKYLTWLNADDILAPGAVAAILKQLKAHPDCEWFTGNFYRFTPDGKVLEVGWGPHCYPRWMQHKTSPVVAFGPSTIFAKSLFERLGAFDVDCHFSMDTEMWIRYITAGIKQRRINHFVWGFQMHADSKTAEFGDHKLDQKQADAFAAERRRYVQKYQYHCSPWRHRLLLFWRLIDGSIFYHTWLRLTFREVAS